MYNWLDVGEQPVELTVWSPVCHLSSHLINHSLTPLFGFISPHPPLSSKIFQPAKYHFSTKGLAYALQVIRVKILE